MVKNNKIKIDLKEAFEKLGKDEDELQLIFKNLEITHSIDRAIYETDAIAILTEWELFKEYNWKSIPNPNIKIFDGRNIVDESFYSIGHP